VVLAEGLWAEVTGTGERGKRVLHFNQPIEHVLNTGFAPLPPYIKRKYDEAVKYRELDLERYQTVYSRTPGSIAAPTAGLHFTPGIIENIEQKTEIIEITLAVGEATFQKIAVEDIVEHRMGREYITITTKDRERILQLKQTKQLIAVGTTSVRSLETFALQQPGEETFASELFISPGFEFKLVDKLVTNFHLPESSLFILVSAFAGLELMQKAYRIAIEEGYRFFSYGDAMFIV
jgi:S-adenosylmethionine:tRNA ribosyltransferase-isomerase